MTEDNGFSEWKNLILDKLEDHDGILSTISTTLGAMQVDLAIIKAEQDAMKGKVSYKVFYFVVLALLAILGASMAGVPIPTLIP